MELLSRWDQITLAFSLLTCVRPVVQCLLIQFTGAKVTNFVTGMISSSRTTYDCISDSIIVNSNFSTDINGHARKSGLVVFKNKNVFGFGWINIASGELTANGDTLPDRAQGTLLYWGNPFATLSVERPTRLYFTIGKSVHNFKYEQHVLPRAWQRELGDLITRGLSTITRADGSKTQIVLLCGDPGAGKTFMGLYLAQLTGYGSTVVLNRATLSNLCNLCIHGKSVIVVDEVDMVFDEINNSALPPETESGRLNCIDKSTWNVQLDAVRFTANNIIVMTTNVPYNELHAGLVKNGNEACIREGRVDIFASVIDDKLILHKPL